jgi:hypothetical protein
MRNDRKGAPARNLVGKGAHQSAIAGAGCGSSLASGSAAPALAMDMMAARPFANSWLAGRDGVPGRPAIYNYDLYRRFGFAAPAASLQQNLSFELKSLAQFRTRTPDPFSLLKAITRGPCGTHHGPQNMPCECGNFRIVNSRQSPRSFS